MMFDFLKFFFRGAFNLLVLVFTSGSANGGMCPFDDAANPALSEGRFPFVDD